MLRKIADNLYSQLVPLPGNPLKSINVYIIKGDDGRDLIIDTGFNMPECEEALRSAFEELDIKSPDVFVTHLHMDHVGLVPKFAGEGSTVYGSEIDGQMVNFGAGNLYWSMLDDLFIKYGMPPAKEGRNTDIHPGKRFVLDGMIDFTYVKEGDVLEYGGYKLEVIETPGHTKGQIGLIDREKKIYFCGDHILGKITPNITIALNSLNPLGDYLESLDKVDKLDIDLLLTAHRELVDDMHLRIAQLREHHEERLEEILSVLGDKWMTAYEVAGNMHWEIRCKNWDDFPMQQKWFATGEAIAHLQYLYSIGKVERDELYDDVYYYRLKRDDCQLHYTEKGVGYPMILLHGNGEDGSHFKAQLDYFSDKYRVIAIDTRGHGQSPRGDAPFRIGQFAEDLNKFMEDKGIPEAVVLGFSDGANIAMKFAFAHQDKIKALVLTGGNLDPDGCDQELQRKIEAKFEELSQLEKKSEKVVRRIEMLDLMISDPNIKVEELHQIAVPTLVMAGTEDIVNDDHTRLIAANIKNSKLEIIDGDHFIAYNKSLEYNKIVEDFLKEI